MTLLQHPDIRTEIGTDYHLFLYSMMMNAASMAAATAAAAQATILVASSSSDLLSTMVGGMGISVTVELKGGDEFTITSSNVEDAPNLKLTMTAV